MLQKTLESPLDCKEIQPVHPEGVQPWDFFGRNDAKAETPVLWPPHAKSWLIGKDYDAGRDWGQEEKGTTEDELAGWHHWLDGHESEWTPGVGDRQGGLACCDSWGHKESDTTERLNWTEGKSGGCAELEPFQSDLEAWGVGVSKVLKSTLPNLKWNARELTPLASSPGSPSLDWQPEKCFSPQITGVGDGKSFYHRQRWYWWGEMGETLTACARLWRWKTWIGLQEPPQYWVRPVHLPRNL